MIDYYEKFRLVDKNGKNDLIAEVNWNTKNKDLNECKVVKFILGGKTAYISKEMLNTMLFVIGSRKEQRKMIPQVLTRVRHLNKTMWVMLKSDAKKGDIIKVPVNITVPAVSEEVISEIGRDLKFKDLSYLKEKLKQEKERDIKTTSLSETDSANPTI